MFLVDQEASTKLKLGDQTVVETVLRGDLSLHEPGVTTGDGRGRSRRAQRGATVLSPPGFLLSSFLLQFHFHCFGMQNPAAGL